MLAVLAWDMHCDIWSRAKVVTTMALTWRVTYWVQMVLAWPGSPFGSWLRTSQPAFSRALRAPTTNCASIGEVVSNSTIPAVPACAPPEPEAPDDAPSPAPHAETERAIPSARRPAAFARPHMNRVMYYSTPL